MKATVDKETCLGCGLCTETCPEVFELDGAVSVVKCETVPPEAEATCREAAEACPAAAIAITE